MYVCGICSKSIEELEEHFSSNDYKFMTAFEFYSNLESLKNCEQLIVIVDSIAKLLSIQNLKILDIEYYNITYRVRPLDLNKLFNKQEFYIEKLDFQYKLTQDYNLGDFSFITHITEFAKDPYLFCKKIHNLLTKTSKEVINCSNKYKDLLKEKLINKEMSNLYLEFLDKKKQDYPELFKYMKMIIASYYIEKENNK